MILQGMRNRVPEGVLSKGGIRVYSPRLETLEDIFQVVEELGELVQRPAEARSLVEDLRVGVASFPAPGTVSRKVALVYGHRPLVVAGGDSWGNELIRLAGHQNVFGTESRTNVQVDAELLLVRAPDVVVDLAAVGSPEVTREFWRDLRKRTGHSGFSVVVTGEPALMRPGPRVLEALKILSELIEGARGNQEP
jgi:iron complex transport system substrate-binding protein